MGSILCIAQDDTLEAGMCEVQSVLFNTQTAKTFALTVFQC
jgi:hypothetical protein